MPSSCCPGFGNDVFNLPIGHGWQPPQYVVQISVGFDPVTATAFDNRVDDGAAFSGLGVTEEQPVLLSKSGWADCILNEVSIDLDFGLLEINLQRSPVSQRIADGFAHCTLWQEASGEVPPL